MYNMKFVVVLGTALSLGILWVLFLVSVQSTSSPESLSLPAQVAWVDSTGVNPSTNEQSSSQPSTASVATQVITAGGTLYEHRLLYRQPGKVIARGTNTSPTSLRGLRTYQLEEVHLPVTVKREGFVSNPADNKSRKQPVTTAKIWRITITADGIPYVGESQLGIWLDDVLVAIGYDNDDGIRGVIYDRTLLREGAKIGVGLLDSDARYYLPEKLHFQNSP